MPPVFAFCTACGEPIKEADPLEQRHAEPGAIRFWDFKLS